MLPAPLRCFFFSDTATTEIYTLSLHDALPILFELGFVAGTLLLLAAVLTNVGGAEPWLTSALVITGLMTRDRKSTRLNSSHVEISYAVFCLKKKITAMQRVLSL